ncbi:MAG: serine hydrolase domain-containing protein [Pyrinomonadaceae bacterium]
MTEHRRLPWPLACFILLAASASGQSNAPRTAHSGQLAAETIKQIEALIQQEMTRQSIPGMSVAVGINGQVRYAKGFGTADLEHSIPVKATTVYRTASIAKPMTATAVVLLAEQGKLDLDAPIQKYCAAFPEKPWPVTARQLLGHLGGVRHYTKPGESSGTTHYFTIEESLKLFKDDPLLHEPGSKFHYTTYGYSVLGCAIEGAAGLGYEDYMQENVFKPAGMAHTRNDDHFFVIPDRARGYLKLDDRTYAELPAVVKGKVKVGQLYNAQLHDTSMKVPGGGLVSTSVDLVKFGHASMTGTFVKQPALERMWTPQQTKDGKKTTYGLGWGVGERAGMKLFSHSGGQAGTSTLLYVLPEKSIVIAAMCNLEGASLGRMLDEIGKALVGNPQQ